MKYLVTSCMDIFTLMFGHYWVIQLSLVKLEAYALVLSLVERIDIYTTEWKCQL